MTTPIPSGPELLVLAAVESLPDIIRGFKELFTRRNPEEPTPTSTEVMLAFNSAFASSLAKDDLWLSQHPEDATN